ncbi:hypothetical protein J7E73_24865, partial [Paenibacillus albidus]|uniref:hypothetical protein n=1 Tax=Paenibacillus albidus TaxID=2041023 RepID=UPI001BEC1FB6
RLGGLRASAYPDVQNAVKLEISIYFPHPDALNTFKRPNTTQPIPPYLTLPYLQPIPPLSP